MTPPGVASLKSSVIRRIGSVTFCGILTAFPSTCENNLGQCGGVRRFFNAIELLIV